MKVDNLTSANGHAVPNQLIITCDDGQIMFQSYGTMIAIKRKGKVTLDRNAWDYSKTTGKYRNQFLGESKAETERKIKSGEYALDNLN